MGQLTLDKIDTARKAGYTDQQIADKFREKLSASDVPQNDIDSFLQQHNLVPSLDAASIASGAAVPEQGEQYTTDRGFNVIPQGNIDFASVMSGAAVPQPGEGISPGPPTPFTRQALPAMGDLALSMLAKKPLTLLTGASRMGRLASGVGQAAAGGIGAGGGEVAAQGLFNEPFNKEAINNQAELGFGFNLGLNALASIIAPTANFLKNNTVRAQGSIKKIKDKIIRETSERAETFVNEMAPDVMKGQVNALDDVSLKMNAALDETRGEYDVYRNAVEQHFKNTGEIDLQNTFDYLEKLREDAAKNTTMGTKLKEGGVTRTEQAEGASRLVKDKALKNSLNFRGAAIQARVIDELLASSRNGVPVTPGQIDNLLSNVFKKGKGTAWETATSKEQERLVGLKDAIKADLDYIPVESGGTAMTAKEAADKNFKALMRYETVLDIWKSSIRKDELGQTFLRPADFAKKVYASERKFTGPNADQNLKEVWPKLKAEADHYVEVTKELTSDAFNPNINIAGGWTDKIPFAPKLGEISAYALLDKDTRSILQRIVRQYGPPTKLGASLGSKVLGSELGFTNNDMLQDPNFGIR